MTTEDIAKSDLGVRRGRVLVSHDIPFAILARYGIGDELRDGEQPRRRREL